MKEKKNLNFVYKEWWTKPINSLEGQPESK